MHCLVIFKWFRINAERKVLLLYVVVLESRITF